jgi:hypothetical protein
MNPDNNLEFNNNYTLSVTMTDAVKILFYNFNKIFIKSLPLITPM